MVKTAQTDLFQIRVKMSRKRSVRQRFYPKLQKCLFIPATAPNDRGYGHWRFAGAFAVVKRQSECGSKTAEMHSQPANAHRRVLGGRGFLFQSF